MITLGVDIGATGAVAVVDGDCQLLEVHDMPILQDGPAGRRTVNAALLAGIIRGAHAELRNRRTCRRTARGGPYRGFCFWPEPRGGRGRARHLRDPGELYYAPQLEASPRPVRGFKGCVSIRSDQALAITSCAFRKGQRRWKSGGVLDCRRWNDENGENKMTDWQSV